MQLYLLVPLLYPAPFKNRTCMYICITRRLKGQLAVAIEVRDADLVTNEGDFMIERELKG